MLTVKPEKSRRWKWIADMLRKIRLPKPALFALWGALGCLTGAIPGKFLLLITYKAPPPPPLPPPPQAICLLIDASGSMNGAKITEAKAAAIRFVKRQDLSQNRVAVVGFGTTAHPMSDLSDAPTALENAITAIFDGGSTRMDLGLAEAAARLRGATQKPVILPVWFTGSVWIRLQPKRGNRQSDHRLTIHWGGWTYRKVLNFQGHKRLSLSHIKRLPDCHWIRVEVNPACSIDYGLGPAPVPFLDINDGWADMEGLFNLIHQFLELAALAHLNPVDVLFPRRTIS